jgi:hypothetical protein
MKVINTLKKTISFFLVILLLLGCVEVGLFEFDFDMFKVSAIEDSESSAMTEGEATPIKSVSTVLKNRPKKAQQYGDVSADGDRVLLIQNTLPWDSNSNIQVLTSLINSGVIVGFDVCTVAEFGKLDLAKYSVISIANDQTTSTYDECAAIIGGLEFFVQGGGVVIFGACDRGWGGNGNLSIDLPCGVQRISTYKSNNYIADSNHPIITGEYSDQNGMSTSSLIGGNYCSHTSFEPNSLPANSHTIIYDEDQNPTLVEYPYGDGKVIASGLTWEYYYIRSGPDFAKKSFDDLYIYALKSSNLKYDELVLNSKADNYIVKVVGSDGSPIEGAKLDIYVGSDLRGTYTSNSIGVVQFPKKADAKWDFIIGNVDFEISKDGYRTYSTKNTNYSYNEAGYEIVVLYSNSESGYKLRSAYYKDTNAKYEDNPLTSKVDIITGTKRLSKTNESILDSVLGENAVETGHFKITCTPVSANGISNYELWQGVKKIATSNNGTFKLKISDFESGKNVFVRVNGKDGKSVDTKLNLEICEDKKNEKSSISFGDKIKISVSDDVPFVGGSDFSFNIPDLPFEIEYEEGKLYFQVNIKKFSADTQDGVAKKKTMKEQYDDIKKSINDVKRLSNYKVGSYLDRSINNFLKEKKKFDIPAVGSIDVKFFGCGTAEWTPGDSLDSLSLELCVIANGSVNKTWQTMVSVVPVVIDITGGVEIKLGAEAKFSFKAKSLNGDVLLNIKPYLNAFGGVGVGKFIGVGAYGNAEVPIEIQLIGTTMPFGVNSIDLTGELGIKAYAGPFEYSKDFAHNTWHIYTRTRGKKVSSKNTETLYSPSAYNIQDISYLDAESDWSENSSLSGIKKVKALNNSDFITLLSNTYRNTQPVLVSTDDVLMIAMIGASNSRNAYNASVAKFAVFNDSTNSFLQPVQIDSNNTADTNIDVFSDGEDIYVTYQDAEKEYSEESFNEKNYALDQNIVVARYNKNTNQFEAQKTFSSKTAYYRYPKMTKIGNKMYLAWISTSGNDFFGQEDSELVYSEFNGTWSEPRVLTTTKAIGDYAIGELDGSFSALCSVDEDCDFSTSDDRILSVFSQTKSVNVSTGESTNLQFVQLPGKAIKGFVWVNAGALNLYDTNRVVEICEIGSPESVSVLPDRILATIASDGASQISAAVYNVDSNSYGEFSPVTDQDKYIEKLSSATYKDVVYLLMTRKTVTVSENRVEDVCDLTYFRLNEVVDLGISFADFEQDQVVPGESLPVNVYVKNNGTVKVDSFELCVANEQNGMILNTQEEVSILPGEEKIISVEVPLPQEMSLLDYSISVHNPNSGADQDNTNDAYVITLGYSDLALQVEMQKINEKNFAVVDVSNQGITATDGIVKMSYKDRVIQYVGFDSLGRGDHQIIMMDVVNGDFDESEVCLDFSVTAYRKEYYDYNNYAKAYLDFNDYMSDEVETIVITNKQSKLNLKEQFSLQYSILPENAAHGQVSFYSGDKNIVIVDNDGTVTPVASGKTTISVFVDGKSDTFTIEVVCPGHKYDCQTKDSTCEENGSRNYTCSICKNSYKEEIPATGHIDKNRDGLCDKCKKRIGGYIPQAECKCICHKTGIVNLIYKAFVLPFWKLLKKNQICDCGLLHYGDWTNICNHNYHVNSKKEATCTESGNITYKCAVCQNEYQEVVAPLGHIDANKDKICDRCKADLKSGSGENTSESKESEICPKCGQVHNKDFLDKIKGFFHKLTYRIENLFKKNSQQNTTNATK